jgi:hypothetical protein
MRAKKPGDLKIKRGKPRSGIERLKASKEQPWYASAALRIGITTKALRDGANRPTKDQNSKSS